MSLTSRHATPADAETLGALNRQLIDDEGHRNAMTVPELQMRMREWLEGDYGAVIFEDENSVAAYVLFRDDAELIYLRQFFVQRDRRQRGYGLEALEILRRDYWPAGKRLTVDVLCANEAGIAFWRKAGFTDYCLTLEMLPGKP